MTLPPEINKIKYFRQSENLYFHNFWPPDNSLENGNLNFGRKKGVPPLQQDFHQDFRSFPWKFKFSNLQYWKLEKIWFYTRNGKKTQNFYSNS